MSCNGCRVLRKGCSDACVIRPSLRWIDSAVAQANATLFVAKFFGRANLLSFLSSVPSSLRPALFQSLLFEACGRTVNPVGGAVGLLWTGRWAACQAAVDTVLNGGAIRVLPDNAGRPVSPVPYSDAASAAEEYSSNLPRPSFPELGISLTFSQRPASQSEASATTSCESGSPQFVGVGGGDRKLLNLFV